jgi:hypothetical protein
VRNKRELKVNKTRFCTGASLAILLLALLVRGGALLVTPGALAGDPDGYRALAKNLAAHGTFGAGNQPTAYRPPLYPIVLRACLALGGDGRVAIGVLHVTLGVATVGMVLALARWWGMGKRAAAVAALLVACDPILVYWSTQVMTETLATFLAVAGLLALARVSSRHRAPCLHGRCAVALGGQTRCVGNVATQPLTADGTRSVPAAADDTSTTMQASCPVPATIVAGAVLALGALCRPELLLWLLAVVIVLGFSRRNREEEPAVLLPGRFLTRSVRSTIKLLCMPAAFALAAIVVLSPWGIRNQFQFGRPIVTTTHGGYTLLLANNPSFYQWLRAGGGRTPWEAGELSATWEKRRWQNELQASRQAYAEAWQTIRQQPATFAYSCLVRLGRLWSPLPHQTVAVETPLRRTSRWLVAAWYLAEFTLAAIGLWLSGFRGQGSEHGIHHSSFIIHHSPWLWGLLLMLCLTAPHAVFWTDMRMRAAAMPVVALAVAACSCNGRGVTPRPLDSPAIKA